jgi:hypothetical protein
VANLDGLRCNRPNAGRFSFVGADIQGPGLNLRASASRPEFDARKKMLGLRVVESMRERRPVGAPLVGPTPLSPALCREGKR